MKRLFALRLLPVLALVFLASCSDQSNPTTAKERYAEGAALLLECSAILETKVKDVFARINRKLDEAQGISTGAEENINDDETNPDNVLADRELKLKANQALVKFEEAATLDPEWVAPYFGQGLAYEFMGNTEEAFKARNEGISILEKQLKTRAPSLEEVKLVLPLAMKEEYQERVQNYADNLEKQYPQAPFTKLLRIFQAEMKNREKYLEGLGEDSTAPSS